MFLNWLSTFLLTSRQLSNKLFAVDGGIIGVLRRCVLKELCGREEPFSGGTTAGKLLCVVLLLLEKKEAGSGSVWTGGSGCVVIDLCVFLRSSEIGVSVAFVDEF